MNVENSNIQFRGGKAQYALYPVWLLNTTWNGNQYLFAMNGQTGLFVGTKHFEVINHVHVFHNTHLLYGSGRASFVIVKEIVR